MVRRDLGCLYARNQMPKLCDNHPNDSNNSGYMFMPIGNIVTNETVSKSEEWKQIMTDEEIMNCNKDFRTIPSCTSND